MKIKVIDIIETSNAITHSLGLEVFDFVKKKLESGFPVELSFEGVRNLTSGFCNASIGNLHQEFPSQADDLLRISDVREGLWKEKIKSAENLAKDSEYSREMDDALADLFE